jgi:hypothetical protein
MDADGTHKRMPVPCRPDPEPTSFDWSPDGTRLILEIATAGPSGRTPRTRQSDLAIVYTKHTDGTAIRRLTFNHAPDLHPDWQRLP